MLWKMCAKGDGAECVFAAQPRTGRASPVERRLAFERARLAPTFPPSPRERKPVLALRRVAVFRFAIAASVLADDNARRRRGFEAAADAVLIGPVMASERESLRRTNSTDG